MNCRPIPIPSLFCRLRRPWAVAARAIALVAACMGAAHAAEHIMPEAQGTWLAVPGGWDYAGPASLADPALHAVPNVRLTGGRYLHAAGFALTAPETLVVDFKNTSIIGNFHHWLYDAQGRLVAEARGGIRDNAPNPFFLSHGRSLGDLPAGHYRLVTELDSPFYLAPPEPYLLSEPAYRQAIKLGNVLALLCLGVFVSLGLYYLVLGLWRRRLTEGMYALFILGNLVFQSAALLVDSDVLGLHSMALIGAPLLFSNMAYVVFAASLLEVRRRTYPRLYAACIAALLVLAAFAAAAAFAPNWALELERYGVPVFLSFGVVAGVARSLEGDTGARLYLGAVSVFFVLGLAAVLATGMQGYALRIEHVGLVAVTAEVLLLAFVLAYQFARLGREREAALQEKSRSDEANVAKSLFLAHMSHEIRTPISAIIGMAQLALWKEHHPEQRKQIRSIMQSGDHLLGIIDDILDFSKIDAGKLALEQIDFELTRVRRDLLNLFEWKAAEKGVRLGFSLDANLPARLSGDPLRLKQVLINLVSNAIKYTDSGEVSVRAIMLDEGAGGLDIGFEVRDTGIGMNAVQRAALFQPFQQGDSSITRKYGGTGLGLAISQRLVHLFGGEIGVESAPGKGSTFWFTARFAPAAAPADAPAAEPAFPAESSAASDEARKLISGTHLLLAEDHPFNQQVAVGMLTDAGATVRVASNGEEAVAMLEREYFDALLMDIQMPVMDGLAATRHIRREGIQPGIPIIALTANAMGDDRATCLAAGMSDFITKPFRAEEFYAIVASWIARRPRPAASHTANGGTQP